MLPFLKFLARRLIVIPLLLLVITAVLFGTIMLTTPVERRARLYWPPKAQEVFMTDEQVRLLNEQIIRQYGMRDPYPVQYLRWASRLLTGDWGWSPKLHDEILEVLLRRTPATLELTFFSLLLLIPLGIVSGVIAGWKRGGLPDRGFRLMAFAATSIPPFILALVLLAVFYAGLQWFPPGRLSSAVSTLVRSSSFKAHTGFMTLDGLLNGRLEVTADAFRHLVLPVVTLSLAHWATLGRITRAATSEEIEEQYVVAARGRGLSWSRTVWRHVLRNAMLPALSSSALSAASLVTGVFVVEILFDFPGVSELAFGGSVAWAPDVSASMGFAVYSVLLVVPLMFVLDVIQAAVDPRIREGVVAS